MGINLAVPDDQPAGAGSRIEETRKEVYGPFLEAAGKTGVPIIVTENGVATDDDARRVEFIGRPLAGVGRCLDDHVDVRGYIHWPMIDNFEWTSGFKQKFGLIAVDGETQKRSVKGSAAYLGGIVRRNGL